MHSDNEFVNLRSVIETLCYMVDDDSDGVEEVMQLPSIDIVFCRECKHGTYCEEADMYICNANDQDLYEAEHFCSYGERREP